MEPSPSVIPKYAFPIWSLVAATALAGLAACDGAASDRQKPPAPQASAVATGEPDDAFAGTSAPDVTLLREGGAPLSLTVFQGTPTLVNLWATWCAPCIAELPALDRLAAREGYALNVVAVSQDIGGWEKIAPFLRATPLPATTVLADPDGALARALDVAGLPVTILYDAEGREVWRVLGPREWDQPGGMPTAGEETAAAFKNGGAAWHAIGQEPGWRVDIVPGETIDVIAAYGETRARFPAPEDVGPAPFDLAVTNAADVLTISATDEPCKDAMSGRPYPQTVSIELNGETFGGCGGPS